MCWRRDRLPTPVFWPGEFHGYGPCGRRVTTEWLSLSLHFLFGSKYLPVSLVPLNLEIITWLEVKPSKRQASQFSSHSALILLPFYAYCIPSGEIFFIGFLTITHRLSSFPSNLFLRDRQRPCLLILTLNNTDITHKWLQRFLNVEGESVIKKKMHGGETPYTPITFARKFLCV